MHAVQPRFLRAADIIGDHTANPPIPPMVPIARSTFWAWVATGKFPKPAAKLSARCTVWRLEDVLAFIENAGKEGS